MNPCPDCGAAMAGDAAKIVCTSCGLQVHRPTPAVEGLNNLCSTCHHPLAPEHDDFGCHMSGCGCTVVGSQLETIQDVLPNAITTGDCKKCGAKGVEVDGGYCEACSTINLTAEKSIKGFEKKNGNPHDDRAKEDAGALWDQASDAMKRKLIAQIGMGIGLIQFRWSQMPSEAKQKLLTEIFGLENAGEPICSCDAGDAEKNPSEHDGRCAVYKASFEKNNTAAGIAAAGAVWDKNSNAQRIELLKQASIAESAGGLVHLTWSQIPIREQQQITRTLGFENKNAAGPSQQDAKRLLAWWDGEHIKPISVNYQDGKTYTREQLEAIASGQVQNAAPDFKGAIAAFEAHAKSCAVCGPVRRAPAGSPDADASKLCPTGSQLLVADLENAVTITIHVDDTGAAKVDGDLPPLPPSTLTDHQSPLDRPQLQKPGEADSVRHDGFVPGMTEAKNADSMAKGGEEAGKKGGTVTVKNAYSPEQMATDAEVVQAIKTAYDRMGLKNAMSDKELQTKWDSAGMDQRTKWLKEAGSQNTPDAHYSTLPRGTINMLRKLFGVTDIENCNSIETQASREAAGAARYGSGRS